MDGPPTVKEAEGRPAIEGVPMVDITEDGGEEVGATVDGEPTVKEAEGRATFA